MGELRDERRDSKRERIILPARCRKYDGLIENVILSDLSANGCRIYADDMALRVGQRLTLQPTKLEGIGGEVRWVDGHRAGIAFDRPLHNAVAEHLQRLFAVPPCPSATGIRVLVSSF